MSLSAASVDTGEATVAELRARQAFQARRLPGRLCLYPKCAHQVKAHYTKDEEPTQKCSIPDCPCEGLLRG